MGWRTLVGAVAALLLAAGCAGTQENEGLAVTGAGDTSATAADATGDEPDGDADSDADTDDDAESDADDTDDTDGDGDDEDPAADLDGTPVTSPSERLTLDLNYDIPDTLTEGLEAGELRNLIVDVHGPTDDLAREINRVGLFPTEFPTVAGSDIHEFNMTLTVHNDPSTVRSKVVFHVPAPVEDVIAFYQAGLTEPAFTQRATGDRTEEDLTIHTIEYDTVTSADSFLSGLSLDFVAGEFAGTFVLAEWNDELTTGQRVVAIDQIAALMAWNVNTPVPDGGQPRSSSLRTSVPSISFGEPPHWLYLTTSVMYPGTPGVELAETALAELADSDYRVREVDGAVPDPDELLAEALDADDGFLGVSLEHTTRDGSPRITFWNLDPERGDGYLDFDSGSQDLTEVP